MSLFGVSRSFSTGWVGEGAVLALQFLGIFARIRDRAGVYAVCPKPYPRAEIRQLTLAYGLFRPAVRGYIAEERTPFWQP